MKAVFAIAVVLGLSSALSQEAVAAGWQDLPVTPALGPVVGGHLEKIAERGERRGNLPGVVAKVGDSITASPSFLQALACSSPRLGPWTRLRGTLGFFGGTRVPRGSEEAGCAASDCCGRRSL